MELYCDCELVISNALRYGKCLLLTMDHTVLHVTHTFNLQVESAMPATELLWLCSFSVLLQVGS